MDGLRPTPSYTSYPRAKWTTSTRTPLQGPALTPTGTATQPVKRGCNRIRECRLRTRMVCDICIPSASKTSPTCALSRGAGKQVPPNLFAHTAGLNMGYHDPNCTAATRSIATELPPKTGTAVMKQTTCNAFSYEFGLPKTNELSQFTQRV